MTQTVVWGRPGRRREQGGEGQWGKEEDNCNTFNIEDNFFKKIKTKTEIIRKHVFSLNIYPLFVW